jgi:hypothetical protein
MAQHSKFLNILNEQLQLFNEDNFVKRNEKSELPDMQDDDEPRDMEQPEVQDEPTPEPEPEKVYTPKEIELLKMASAFYQANEEYEANSKSEIFSLEENEDWESLDSVLTNIYSTIS